MGWEMWKTRSWVCICYIQSLNGQQNYQGWGKIRNKLIVGSDYTYLALCENSSENKTRMPMDFFDLIIYMDAKVHLCYVRIVMDEDWWEKPRDLGSDTISSVLFGLRMRL